MIEVGGNKFKLWLGTELKKVAEKLIEGGKKNIISNPSCKLINPFTLIINFSVNNEKYQLILQGNYKEKYKDSDDGNLDIDEKSMFLLINQSRKNWFKKS